MKSIDDKTLTFTTDDDKRATSDMTFVKSERPLTPEEDELRKKRSSTTTRTITAIVMTIFALPVVLLGDWFLFTLVVAGLMTAIWEIIKCGRIKYTIFLYIVTYISAIFLMIMPLLRGFITERSTLTQPFTYFADINFSPLIVFIVILALFLTVIVDKNFTVREACFLFTMIFIIVFGLQSALYLRYIPVRNFHQTLASQDEAAEAALPYFNVYDNFNSAFLLLWVVMSGVLSDTGGYIFGMLFGQTKMNERISPKKTWEGFFGGVFFSFIICTLFGFLIPALTRGSDGSSEISLLPGVLDLEHWYNIMILAAILPPTSVIGDFVFSSIKRFNGIKDYGNIFPGHGGVLDRIDSLLFTCMTAATYIYIWETLAKTVTQ